MAGKNSRIALTGFMGVGKSTVARHLARISGKTHEDLDDLIETSQSRSIPTIIRDLGIERFREIEAHRLNEVLDDERIAIISLGGGTWTFEKNRDLIKAKGVTTVWLETTFDHCWRNIRSSRKRRPLVENKEQARALFRERERLYCLADWHFVIEPGQNSYEVAQRIAVEIFSIKRVGETQGKG